MGWTKKWIPYQRPFSVNFRIPNIFLQKIVYKMAKNNFLRINYTSASMLLDVKVFTFIFFNNHQHHHIQAWISCLVCKTLQFYMIEFQVLLLLIGCYPLQFNLILSFLFYLVRFCMIEFQVFLLKIGCYLLQFDLSLVKFPNQIASLNCLLSISVSYQSRCILSQ